MKNLKINPKFINKKVVLDKKFKALAVGIALTTGLVTVASNQEPASVVDIGDHTSFDSILSELKICLKHFKNDDLGIIVTPTKINESGIYNDVEIAKTYLTNYDITLPVYLNIQPILDSRDINLTNKKALIHTFLEKCSKNGMYVGVYGNDSILTKYYEELDVKNYDAYIVKDSKEMTYPGTANIVEDLDNNLTVNPELASKVKNKNTKDLFVSDYCHIVGSNETIDEIAMEYDMSVKGLLSYNGLFEFQVKEGTKLRIPHLEAIMNPKVETIKSNVLTTLDNPLKGCDISQFQGSTDWDLLKKNFEFVILRASYGTTEDKKFKEYASKCDSYNIKMGAYCFNTVTGTKYNDIKDFEAAAVKQADYVINLLKDEKVTYPVYLDLENDGSKFEDDFNKEEIDTLLRVWNEKMKDNGYIPGIYSNKSIYHFITNNTSFNIPESFETWIAGGEQYTSEKNGIDIKDIVPVENEYNYKDSNYKVDTTQVTDEAINGGAGNDKGHLDINYTYTDYENSNDVYDDYFKSKEFEKRLLWSLKEELAVLGLGIAAGATVYSKNKKRPNSKRGRK